MSPDTTGKHGKPMAARRAQHEQDLEQLLEICEQFFSHAGPVTCHEADTLLRAHGIYGAGLYKGLDIRLTR